MCLILVRYRKKKNHNLVSAVNKIYADHVLSFSRYYFALKCGFQSAFKQSSCEDKLSGSPTGDIHKQAIDAVTDISMLRVFKIFLETTPQLLLQIHILMEEDKTSFIQCNSLSLLSVSWKWNLH